MALTPEQIIDAVSGYSDPGKAGIAAVAMMETSDDYSGPYDNLTRDWMQRYLTDQCSYYRILRAASYALNASGAILPSVSTAPQAAYGARKMVAGYTGPCCRIVRASDSTEQDIGFTAGSVDMAAAAAFAAGSELTVKTWYDQSGNGRDATQATLANQPRLRAANAWRGMQGLTFDSYIAASGGVAANKFLAMPAGVVINRRANTSFCVAAPRADYNDSALFEIGTTATRALLLTQVGGVGLRINFGSTGTTRNALRFPRMNPSVLGLRCGAAQTNIYVDDRNDVLTVATAGVETGGQIGSSLTGGLGLRGEFFAFVSYAVELSDADSDAVRAALKAIYSAANTNQPSLMVVDGDSITEGASDTFLMNNIRQALPQVSSDLHVHNLAVHGTTAATEYGRRVAKFDGVARTGMAKRIAVLGLGTNDLSASVTASTLWTSSVLPYIQYVQSQGYAVIVGTIIPRGGSFTGTMDIERLAYNQLLRDNAATYGFAVADYCGLPQFDAQSDASNTTYYYTDAVHPVSIGYALMSQVLASAVNVALAA